jgi:hypothetical protein
VCRHPGQNPLTTEQGIALMNEDSLRTLSFSYSCLLAHNLLSLGGGEDEGG